MPALISFWSHALATSLFASLLLWRLVAGARQPGHRLLLGAFALTACWAWLEAIAPATAMASFAETARNLVWVGLLYSLFASSSDQRQKSVPLVYAAVSAVLGLQLVVTSMLLVHATPPIEATDRILRITAAAGSLVLVHNLYGQASPSSRSNIRFAMLALAMIWTYDLNFYTIAYLEPEGASGLADWRGMAVALTAPLFAMAARREDDWRIRLSRAATFQSLSLLAICAYFAVMAVLATALRGTGVDWFRSLSAALLALMVVGAMVLVPSQRARSWAKVKIAKHLFEHRYDYRSEWLRFTGTLGGSEAEAGALGERVVKAFTDILEAPGGLLLECEPSGSLVTAAAWNWPGRAGSQPDPQDSTKFWDEIGESGRILELDGIRHGWNRPDSSIDVPQWIVDEPHSWVGVPLIHHDKAIGLVLIAAPEYRRPLDWEDFDLLRTAGRQAASSLAEAQGQRALSNAQRFEEFNRRFAFILHDIKNLVSQLSLLTRNAERHAGNEEFRADMIATLKSSIGKMNELLTRLSPQASARPHRIEPQPLREILSAAIAARRGDHKVRLLGDCNIWAEVDPAALQQAVGHLLQNAVEASGGDSAVTIRVARSGADVTIKVADKGCGMDSDFVRSRLFQPFASTKADGFGIGAFEAQSLVAAMGGRISVESRPGHGSIFTIHLTAAAEPAPLQQQRKIA
ncbi:MAG TPA: XrtA/PEP-CTERM system histidine kinase PrsK [Sphingomicrobium sp.]|nr:XrtA/PEP-CTERM system histidine kinase PrsK [Sphingomicrobium sp.]